MTTTTEAIQSEKQLVVFDLASELYGVDIGIVREIIRLQELTKIPETPSYMEGVINLRGKVIPVIDLRKRFGQPVSEQNKDNRIVVIDVKNKDIGVIVDAVAEVLRVSADSIEPASSIITTSNSDYLLGICKNEDRLIIILDMELALSDIDIALDGIVVEEISDIVEEVSERAEEDSELNGEELR